MKIVDDGDDLMTQLFANFGISIGMLKLSSACKHVEGISTCFILQVTKLTAASVQR